MSSPCNAFEIGRAHVLTTVTFRNLVCRLLLEKKKNRYFNILCHIAQVKKKHKNIKIFFILTFICIMSINIYPLKEYMIIFFFFKSTAANEIYTNLNTLSLHDALPI